MRKGIIDSPKFMIIKLFNLQLLTLWWYESDKHSTETILQILSFDLFLSYQCALKLLFFNFFFINLFI